MRPKLLNRRLVGSRRFSTASAATTVAAAAASTATATTSMMTTTVAPAASPGMAWYLMLDSFRVTLVSCCASTLWNVMTLRNTGLHGDIIPITSADVVAKTTGQVAYYGYFFLTT